MPASPLHDDMHSVLPDVADSLGSTVIVGCQKCGETESQVYIVIDGKDYCRACAALVRLEEFHQRVAGDQ